MRKHRIIFTLIFFASLANIVIFSYFSGVKPRIAQSKGKSLDKNKSNSTK
jgi:hypothetical protein